MNRLALLILLVSAGPLKADEDGPTVEFTLADGWVNLHLHKGDTPVTNAEIVVLVGDGEWAKGETDDKGKGTFPRPKADHCQVVFVYSNDSTSAPVPLTFTGDKLTPATATVGGALPACCLIAPSETPPDPGEDPSLARSRLAVFAVVLVLGGAVAVVAYRKTIGVKS